MPFPIVTVLGAAMGIGSAVSSGIASNQKAAAQNRAATRKWDLDRMQANAQYQLANLQAETNFAWDQAQVAQLRLVETQNAVDQAAWGSQMIENAIRNLDINSEALKDRFVTEENLRGTQEFLSYDYAQTARAAEASQTAANYLRSIRNNALQAEAQVQKAQNASVELQEGLLLQEQKDYLEYNVQQAAAIAADAQTKARVGVRQGMGNTSKRLAMEAGQRLGNLAQEINVRQQDRKNKRATMNAYMSGELATSLAQLSLSTEQQANSLKYSNDAYARDWTLAKNQLEKLTIPSFDLGARQYKRELQSLQLQTDQVFQQAGQEYRKKEYMDPVKQVPGLAPMIAPPSKVQGQSTGSIIASSLMAGVGGALGGYEGKGKWG